MYNVTDEDFSLSKFTLNKAVVNVYPVSPLSVSGVAVR